MSVILKLQADGYSKQCVEREDSSGEQHIPFVLPACKMVFCREKEISLAEEPGWADWYPGGAISALWHHPTKTNQGLGLELCSRAGFDPLCKWKMFSYLDLNLSSTLKMSTFRMSRVEQWQTLMKYKALPCLAHMALQNYSGIICNLQRKLSIPTGRPISLSSLDICSTVATSDNQ